MTQYSAVIRLEDKPYKIIKWFTQNFDKEVGAIGIGKVVNGEVVVSKLVFPKQIVNGVHVHFKPEDWAPLMTELSNEEMEQVIFYWHKHPDNCPSASQGDEDDTFDTFMDETSGRKMFAFLQSANSKDGIKFEGRIEMREPVWCSITDVEIVTDEDYAINEECKAIIRDKITTGYASASDQPGSEGKPKSTIVYDWDKKTFVDTEKEEAFPLFDIEKRDGAVYVTFDLELKEYMEMIIEYDNIKPLISNKTMFENTIKDTGLLRIFPTKGNLDKLYDAWKEQLELYEACADYNRGFEPIEEIIETNIKDSKPKEIVYESNYDKFRNWYR